MKLNILYIICIFHLSNAINLIPHQLLSPALKNKVSKKYSGIDNSIYEYKINTLVAMSLDISCFKNNNIAKESFYRQLHVISGMKKLDHKLSTMPTAENKIRDGIIDMYLVRNCVLQIYQNNKKITQTEKLLQKELAYINSL